MSPFGASSYTFATRFIDGDTVFAVSSSVGEDIKLMTATKGFLLRLLMEANSVVIFVKISTQNKAKKKWRRV